MTIGTESKQSSPFPGPQQRKEDHVPDRRGVGEEHDKPVNADCLRAAIRYNEIHIDIRMKNIEALRRALARLLGTPAPSPAHQESARKVGAGVE